MNKVLKNAGFAGLMLLATAQGFAQSKSDGVPQGWHMLDSAKDGYFGISVEKAYQELLKGRKSSPVVVAVIDSGIDTLHEDLKPILWRTPKEKRGKDGYVDAVYGWNFLGGKDGRNVKEDSYEAARVYHKLKLKFGNPEGTDTTAWSKDPNYATWLKVKTDIESKAAKNGQAASLRKALDNFKKSDSLLRAQMGKPEFTGHELEKFTPTTDEGKLARNMFLNLMKSNEMMDVTDIKLLEDFSEYVAGQENSSSAATAAPKDFRGEIVKDNYDDFSDRYYGNSDVMASTPFHGTHVSGIIGAKRDNGIGINGIADNVQIMMIRAVPDGDEHDKDIALAIRYAVDNGAKVINMSFGKPYSPEKAWVDDAVRYAESKGVLLVHAAGNDAKNIDVEDNYPNPIMQVGNNRAPNFITVGASGDPKAGGYTASFSNYGKNNVDVFAPGVKIYSTVPGGNTYRDAQGTSMASPVVAGIAALILEYYPKLSPAQVKEIIEKSVVVPGVDVVKPGTGEKVPMSELCRTGGIVNAYRAIQLADDMYGGKKVKKAKK